MSKQVFNTSELGPHIGPYSHVVKAGGWVFPSGQVGFDRQGILKSGLRAQAEQAFENLRVALAVAGANMADVVTLRIYVPESEDITTIRDIREKYLGPDFPATVVMRVPRLMSRDVLIELEASAYTGD